MAGLKSFYAQRSCTRDADEPAAAQRSLQGDDRPRSEDDKDVLHRQNLFSAEYWINIAGSRSNAYTMPIPTVWAFPEPKSAVRQCQRGILAISDQRRIRQRADRNRQDSDSTVAHREASLEYPGNGKSFMSIEAVKIPAEPASVNSSWNRSPSNALHRRERRISGRIRHTRSVENTCIFWTLRQRPVPRRRHLLLSIAWEADISRTRRSSAASIHGHLHQCTRRGKSSTVAKTVIFDSRSRADMTG